MDRIFIPTLHTFAMNNIFTGSCGNFRFKIVPDIHMKTPKEVDFEASTMKVEYWHGIFCYEKSIMEGEAIFPLTEQGRSEMQKWLIENI